MCKAISFGSNTRLSTIGTFQPLKLKCPNGLKSASMAIPTFPRSFIFPAFTAIGHWLPLFAPRCATDVCGSVEMTYPRSLTWHVKDYSDAIETALLERGITNGWLPGESFGSQLCWPLLERNLELATTQPNVASPKTFRVEGLILAGGFVKHPWPWGPGALRWIGEMTPMSVYRLELKIYSWYSRFRHRKALEVLDTIAEFVGRRTEPDRQSHAASPHFARPIRSPRHRPANPPAHLLSRRFRGSARPVAACPQMAAKKLPRLPASNT